KAALHRGRGKLAAPEPERPRRVPRAMLDAFVEAFNARDVSRLTALMLDDATAEIAGISTEYGTEKMKQTDTGSLHHTLFSPISHAVQPQFLAGYQGGPPRAEVHDSGGESVVICWYDHEDGPRVRDVMRIGVDDDRITSIRYHFFSPDVLAEVCGELDLPWQSNGYGYWPRRK
ncbi:MAG TPA: RNA polymerase sigma factor, partial [Vicinamibacteria bacterium]